jgi:hypothetical protein
MNYEGELKRFDDLERRALHTTRIAGSLIRKLIAGSDAANLELLAAHVAELKTLRLELSTCYRQQEPN